MSEAPRPSAPAVGATAGQAESPPAGSATGPGHVVREGARPAPALAHEPLGMLSVERWVPEGLGLARRPDGRVVFVEGAVPGDEVEALRLASRGGAARVTQFRLARASPDRRPPACSVAERCGGCDWMKLRMPAQLRGKRELLLDALQRIGKLRPPPPLGDFEPAPPDAYRCRVRLALRQGRLGFHERGSSALVETDSCHVASPVVRLALAQVRRVLEREPSGAEGLSSVEVRAACDGSVSLFFKPVEARRGPRRPSAPARRLLSQLRENFHVAVGRNEAAHPSVWQRFDLPGGVHLRVPPGCFVQVNWAVNHKLVSALVEGARERGIRSFCDLYCGAGNFSLPLLALGLTGHAVEGDPLAIEGAKAAARDQGFRPSTFAVGDVSHSVTNLARSGARYDLVVLDPPRSGLNFRPEVLAALTGKALALCSCNPVTLARDLQQLLTAGFELEFLKPFDMFPQTHHVEILAWLRPPR